MSNAVGSPSVLSRTHPPEADVVFFAMPFGTRPVDGAGGPPCDFDNVYAIVSETLRKNGFHPERLDGLYGPTAMIDLIWRSIQRAEYVVVDFTSRNHNVTFEFGLALVLGKKIVMITQDIDHVPSDYRGHRVLSYSLMYDPMENLKSALVEQIKALRELPSQEQDLTRLWSAPGYHVSASATVIQVEREYAVVRTDDPSRPPAVLSNADVDLSRIINDMSRRFKEGDRVDGAFVGDPRKGTAKYTLVAGQEDPWPGLASQYPVGKVFTSVVHSARDGLGLFVTVADDVRGLVPEKSLVGPVPPPGTPVEVRVIKVDTVNRRVSLRVNRPLAAVAELPRTVAGPADAQVGQRGFGKVVKAVPHKDGRGGFILLQLTGRERPAMLLSRDMTPDLRDDLADGEVDIGEEIYVEVTQVDQARDRVLLRELPDPRDKSETDAQPDAAAA
jgi:small subunit ribosomal protein S1